MVSPQVPVIQGFMVIQVKKIALGHNQNTFGISQLISGKVTLTTRGDNYYNKGTQPKHVWNIST
jgi:hypothetical protein